MATDCKVFSGFTIAILASSIGVVIGWMLSILTRYFEQAWFGAKLGDWPGQREVAPLAIGEMRVVCLIEGGETPALSALRNDVQRILEQEKSAFEKAPHPAAAPAASRRARGRFREWRLDRKRSRA